MNRLLFLGFIFAAGLISLGGSCTEGGDWGSTLSGTVLDSVTGQPIAGVLIYAHDTSFLATDSNGTDTTGVFQLIDFGYWEFEALFRCPGYKAKDTVLGTRRFRNDVTGVKIVLSPE